MIRIIILDGSWSKNVLDLATQFNSYAKNQSLKMVSVVLDKSFDLLTNDKSSDQYDAARFLQRVRAVNPELINPYMSTLIDAKFGKSFYLDKNYLTPEYAKLGVVDEPKNQKLTIKAEIREIDNPKEAKKEEEEDELIVDEVIEPKNQEISAKSEEKEVLVVSTPQDTGSEKKQELSEIFSWRMQELIACKVIKNLEEINYSQIKSPIKKCACNDGYFERGETNLWCCSSCKTAYHEQCAKITGAVE